VPIPWEKDSPACGFSYTGKSWLPQPAVFGDLARDQQEKTPGSTLELYKKLLALRAQYSLGQGTITWLDGYPEGVVALVHNSVSVVANVDHDPIELPAGKVLVVTGELVEGRLPRNTTAWVVGT
jgi:alpha-glucosidase